MKNQSEKPISNRTMPLNSVIPVLVYDDLEKAIDWLCTNFGFRLRWKAGNHRAQLNFGNGTIAISERQDRQHTGPVSRPAAHSMLLRVNDVDAHYEHANKSGVKIIQAPEDFDYGERQYSGQDLGGHVWTFSQSINDIAPEEWGGTSFEL